MSVACAGTLLEHRAGGLLDPPSAARRQCQQPPFVRGGQTAVLNPRTCCGRILVQPKRCDPIEGFIANFRIRDRNRPCRCGIRIFSQQTISVSAERFIACRAAESLDPFAGGREIIGGPVVDGAAQCRFAHIGWKRSCVFARALVDH